MIDTAEGAEESSLGGSLLGKADGNMLGGSEGAARKFEARLLGTEEEAKFETGVILEGTEGSEIGSEALLLGSAEEGKDGVMLGGSEGSEKTLLGTAEGKFDNGVLLGSAEEGISDIGMTLDGDKEAKDNELKPSLLEITKEGWSFEDGVMLGGTEGAEKIEFDASLLGIAEERTFDNGVLVG